MIRPLSDLDTLNESQCSMSPSSNEATSLDMLKQFGRIRVSDVMVRLQLDRTQARRLCEDIAVKFPNDAQLQCCIQMQGADGQSKLFIVPASDVDAARTRSGSDLLIVTTYGVHLLSADTKAGVAVLSQLPSRAHSLGALRDYPLTTRERMQSTGGSQPFEPAASLIVAAKQRVALSHVEPGTPLTVASAPAAVTGTSVTSDVGTVSPRREIPHENERPSATLLKEPVDAPGSNISPPQKANDVPESKPKKTAFDLIMKRSQPSQPAQEVTPSESVGGKRQRGSPLQDGKAVPSPATSRKNRPKAPDHKASVPAGTVAERCNSTIQVAPLRMDDEIEETDASEEEELRRIDEEQQRLTSGVESSNDEIVMAPNFSLRLPTTPHVAVQTESLLSTPSAVKRPRADGFLIQHPSRIACFAHPNVLSFQKRFQKTVKNVTVFQGGVYVSVDVVRFVDRASGEELSETDYCRQLDLVRETAAAAATPEPSKPAVATVQQATPIAPKEPTKSHPKITDFFKKLA